MKVALDNNTNRVDNIVTVKRCVTNINGRPISVAQNNPLLHSWEYEIELEDSTTDHMFANNLVEYVYLLLYDKGIEIMILKGGP